MSTNPTGKRPPKKKERTGSAEATDYVDANGLLDYLRAILSRYSGYRFISLSQVIPNPEGTWTTLLIKVHRELPAFVDGPNHSKVYQSIKELPVKVVGTPTKVEFQGLLMDQTKQFIYDNPFDKFEHPDRSRLVSLGKPDVTHIEPPGTPVAL